jgi:hypothetical protein
MYPLSRKPRQHTVIIEPQGDGYRAIIGTQTADGRYGNIEYTIRADSEQAAKVEAEHYQWNPDAYVKRRRYQKSVYQR